MFGGGILVGHGLEPRLGEVSSGVALSKLVRVWPWGGWPGCGLGEVVTVTMTVAGAVRRGRPCGVSEDATVGMGCDGVSCARDRRIESAA